MRKVVVHGTSLSVSRFSFGTASLHHLGCSRAQCAHLAAAADCGFSHFDTAPLYGFGEAERAIGRAFGASTDVTVATKVGLYPPGGCEQSRPAVLARKALGRFFSPLSRAVADLGVARARRSLEDSLRRLGRDRVDLLLLHEPDFGLCAADEFQRWLQDEAGRVGAFGVAGPAAVVEPFVSRRSPLATVVQTRDDIATREADFMPANGRQLQFTYGYLGHCADGLSAAEVLGRALERNASGSIVVSTRNRKRLDEFVRVAAEPRGESLEGKEASGC